MIQLHRQDGENTFLLILHRPGAGRPNRRGRPARQV